MLTKRRASVRNVMGHTGSSGDRFHPPLSFECNKERKSAGRVASFPGQRQAYMHSSHARASAQAFFGASSVPPCMIVEDEPGTRTIISRALASHGLFACEFPDIDAAIRALQDAQPKLIFLNTSLSDATTL